jgi:hypothetical protein
MILQKLLKAVPVAEEVVLGDVIQLVKLQVLVEEAEAVVDFY